MNETNPLNRHIDQTLQLLIDHTSAAGFEESPSTELVAVGQQVATSPVLYQEQSPLASLSIENLVSIFLRLRLSDYKNLMLVCRQFKIILTENESFFQGLLSRYFPNYLSSSSATPIQDYERALKTRYDRYWSTYCPINSNDMPFCLNQDSIYALSNGKIEANKRSRMDSSFQTFDFTKHRGEKFQHLQSEGNFLLAAKNDYTTKDSTILTLYELDRDSIDVEYTRKIELKIENCVDTKLYIKAGKPILLTLSCRESKDVIKIWEPNDKMEKWESRTILRLYPNNLKNWEFDKKAPQIRSCCVELDLEGNQLFVGDSTDTACTVNVWKQNENGDFAEAGGLHGSNTDQPKRLLFKDGFLCVQTGLSLTVWKKDEKSYFPVLKTSVDGFSFHNQELVTVNGLLVKLYKINKKGDLEEKKGILDQVSNLFFDEHFFVIENKDGFLATASKFHTLFFDFLAPKKRIFEQIESEFTRLLPEVDPSVDLCNWISSLKKRLLAMPETDLNQIFGYLREILKLSSVKEARDAFNGHHGQKCSSQQIAQAINKYLLLLTDEENASPAITDQLKTIHAFQEQVLTESRNFKGPSLWLLCESRAKDALRLADEVCAYAVSIKSKNPVSPESRQAMTKTLQILQKLLKIILTETINKQKEQEIEISCFNALVMSLYDLIINPQKIKVFNLSLDAWERNILLQHFSQIVANDTPGISWEEGSKQQKSLAACDTISSVISHFSNRLNAMQERREEIESLVKKLAAFDSLIDSNVPSNEVYEASCNRLKAMTEKMVEIKDHGERLADIDFLIDAREESSSS
jgi:hypothetical protein